MIKKFDTRFKKNIPYELITLIKESIISEARMAPCILDMIISNGNTPRSVANPSL